MHYKTKKWLCFLTCLLAIINFPSSLQAQSSQTESSIPYKWDASIDVYDLLKSGTGNVLLRYAPDPTKKAYRMGIDRLEFSHYKSPNDNLTYNQFNIGLSAGIEYRKTVDRFQLYGGPGLAVGFNHSTGTNNYNELTIGPEAFVGVRYFILPRLALSAESAMRFTYYHSKSIQSNTNKEQTYSALNTKFIPLKAIHVSFFF